MLLRTPIIQESNDEGIWRTLMNCREESSKTTVKELKDMLGGLIRQGKGDYKVDFIIFTGYERGHEISDSKIALNEVDDDEKTITLQGDV